MTNVTVGTGKVVHGTWTWNGDLMVKCGAGGVGSAQVRTGISGISVTDKPVTCKKCLAIINRS